MILQLDRKNELLIHKFKNVLLSLYNIDIENEFKTNPYTKYLLYCDADDKVLGVLHYDDIYDRFEISSFDVKEECRNQGIGNKLLNYLIDIAKLNQIQNITLEVRKNNFVAIHLYHKYHFIDCVIRKNYYKDEDGILMKLDMNQKK